MEKNNYKKLMGVEEEFFDLDKENLIAHMKLSFASPDEIFDKNALTKIPVFNDDFSEWLPASFEYIPNKYKLDLDIVFDDLGAYTEEELKEIFAKNMALEFKKSEREKNNKSKIAVGLLITGILFLIAMLLFSTLLKEGVWKEIVVAITEIASWVTIWEALAVFIVENSERRKYLRSISRRFGNIEFHKREK